MAVTVEQLDVLSPPARLDVGQIVVVGRLQLDEQITFVGQNPPGFVTEMANVDQVRLGGEVVEDALRRFEVPGTDGALQQRLPRHQRVEVVRVHPEERAVERRVQDVVSSEELELGLLDGRRGRELDLAFTEEDERRDAPPGVGDEGHPLGQREREIGRRNREVADDVLLLGMQLQSEQSAHRRQTVQPDDAPVRTAGKGLAGDGIDVAANVQQPGRHIAGEALLAKDLDQHGVSVTGGNAAERPLAELVDRHVGDTGHDAPPHELSRSRSGGKRRREHPQIGRGPARDDRALELLVEPGQIGLGGVGFSWRGRRLGGQRRRQRAHQQHRRHATQHGQSKIRHSGLALPMIGTAGCSPVYHPATRQPGR